jgi:hypothetical protein
MYSKNQKRNDNGLTREPRWALKSNFKEKRPIEGPRYQQEKITVEKKLETKDCSKREEIRRFLSVNTYKVDMMLEGGE